MKAWHYFLIVLTLPIIGLEVRGQFRQPATLLDPLTNLARRLCVCGIQTRKHDVERIGSARIFDGRFPWLAELVTVPGAYRESYTGFELDYPLCFGTLINLRTVLLPASCLNKYARSNPRIKLHGVQNRSESIVEVRSAFIHPRYHGKIDNDIALVKLKNPVNYTQLQIVPICLPKVKKIIYPVPYPTSSTNNAYTIDEFNRLPLLEEDTITTELGVNVDGEDARARPCRNPNPPCVSRPCPPCPKTKMPYVLENLVIRRWFNRRGPGYEYVQRFGSFQIQKLNDSTCQAKFPEMLRDKVLCVQQKQIKDVMKQRFDFFFKMEMGMPSMLLNTTLVRGKPQPATTKFYLEGMRAPGRKGIPLFEARDNATVMIKIRDYIPWIMENTFESDYCIV